MLSIPASAHRAIVAHVHREFPLEACGLLLGDAATARVSEFVPTRNQAASSTLYSVHPLDYMAAEDSADSSGLEIIGVVHSHTHTDPYPSRTDLDAAVDPSWHYVIVSLKHLQPMLRSFQIDTERGVEGIVEETVVVVDD